MRTYEANPIVFVTLIACAFGQPESRAAEDATSIVIAEGRTNMAAPDAGNERASADDGSGWEASSPVLQAMAAARSHWSAEDPDFEENLQVRGSANGAFTQQDVEQHAVLFMMSNIPRCCPRMGLAIVEGDRLIRNIAFTTPVQSVRAIPDTDGDGRSELAFGGSFVGQGLVTEGVTLAAFRGQGLVDFGQAIIFESACNAGYGDTGATAARLSFAPGTGITTERYSQASCDVETWEPDGEPEPLQPITAGQETVYTEIPPGLDGTE